MIKRKLFLVTFMLCLCSSYAQTEGELEITINNLSKTWEVYDVINDDKTASELEEIKSMLEGTSLKLNIDMTFAFSFVLDLEGTWTLKDNVIYTKDSRGNNTWTIHSLKMKTITLSRNKAKQKLVFKSN